MAVRWSRIHAELGVAPADLTFDMIVRAVEEGVAETEDLDWKQTLPVDVDRKLKEYAKDVAAMANTGGGMIVYGVREEQERAVDITPVSIAERERERMRALVARHVRPLIAGIEILPLTNGDDDTGVLVVSVPASPDAPHVVGERNEMGIPFRHGAHTEWMSEHQLERAYRDRFTRQAGEATAVAALFDDLWEQLNLDKGPWLMVAGRPLNPLPAVMGRPEPGHVKEVVTDALGISNQIYPPTPVRGRVLDEIGESAILNPRIGLRRWVARSNTDAPPGVRTDLIHVELHHDGTSTIAVALGVWASRGSYGQFHPVPTRILQYALTAAVAVATSHARRRGHTGRMLIEARVHTSGPPYAFAAVDNHVGGGMYVDTMQVIPRTQTTLRVTPAQTEVAADAEPDVLRGAVRQLSEDLLHQFGVLDVDIPE